MSGRVGMGALSMTYREDDFMHSDCLWGTLYPLEFLALSYPGF